MAELHYYTKIRGPVSLKSGYNNGRVAVEVWFENSVIAAIDVEFLWDFMAELFQENPPRNVPGSRGQMPNYIDKGSRYYAMAAAQRLRCVLYSDNPNLLEVMEKIEQLSSAGK